VQNVQQVWIIQYNIFCQEGCLSVDVLAPNSLSVRMFHCKYLASKMLQYKMFSQEGYLSADILVQIMQSVGIFQY
jgi:hypothetical protein